MQTPDFSLHSKAALPSVRRWVWLAVLTLAVSGIAPLILLAGRASMFAESAPIKTLFHEALVIHVDLSVLAWFLAISLLFWALVSHHRPSRLPYLRRGSRWLYGAGCAVIAISPLLGDGVPLMSNYIPVYTSPLFFTGLSLLLSAIVLGLIDMALSAAQADATTPHQAALRFGVIGSAYIVALSLLLFGWSYLRLDGVEPGTQDYYEMLFWAGGHGLQLAYTQLLLVAWAWLAHAAKLPVSLSPRLLLGIFSIYPLVATLSPIGFLNDTTPYDLHFFTMQMRHGGGIAIVVLALFLIIPLLKTGLPSKENRLPWICLLSSMIVFAVGGAIGYMITESNTTIPAHYHGSIVGTTLAFMGVVYLLLPVIGSADLRMKKLALIQPLLYGGGSIMHAVGLALAGSYGVARKTVGALEEAHSGADAALQFMRLGGVIAVIGGALFIVLVIMALRKK